MINSTLFLVDITEMCPSYFTLFGVISTTRIPLVPSTIFVPCQKFYSFRVLATSFFFLLYKKFLEGVFFFPMNFLYAVIAATPPVSS